MAIDLYAGIMYHLNVLNVLNVQITIESEISNPSLIIMKISFWHYIRWYSYTN